MAARPARSRRPRIGLALAGGGPLGAIYEIGALCALADALPALDLSDCDSYVGISAGGFLAAGLANGMTPRQLCAAFIDNSADPQDCVDPALLLHPAWDEYGARLARLPGLLGQSLWQLLIEGRSPLSAFERLSRALPTGLLSGDALAQRVHELFLRPGRSDDFRQLRHRLLLVATDLDNGQAVPFGSAGWEHVPISRAVQASAALPGLFPPVEIEGRHYVDGALKKTLHASLLLDQGVDLLLCLNPLVPYQAHRAQPGEPAPRIPRLIDGGLPVVLSQTLRSLIHSRLELGMRGYAHSHPQADIVLLEPDPQDAELFMANTFSYGRRRHLAEHAYQSTRALLLSRAAELAPRLQRHGLQLDRDALQSPRRLLAEATPSPGAQALQRLEQSLQWLEDRNKT